MSQTMPRWRKWQQRTGEGETWSAAYRGWTMFADQLEDGSWTAALSRRHEKPVCPQRYPTLEGAQNAAEFYAEKERWPHAAIAETA